jgi:hypothetical protein
MAGWLIHSIDRCHHRSFPVKGGWTRHPEPQRLRNPAACGRREPALPGLGSSIGRWYAVRIIGRPRTAQPRPAWSDLKYPLPDEALLLDWLDVQDSKAVPMIR